MVPSHIRLTAVQSSSTSAPCSRSRSLAIFVASLKSSSSPSSMASGECNLQRNNELPRTRLPTVHTALLTPSPYTRLLACPSALPSTCRRPCPTMLILRTITSSRRCVSSHLSHARLTRCSCWATSTTCVLQIPRKTSRRRISFDLQFPFPLFPFPRGFFLFAFPVCLYL